MLSEEAYRKFRAGRLEEVTQSEAESFFRLNDYVMGKARERKVTRAVNVFREDTELGKAVVHLAKIVLGRHSLD